MDKANKMVLSATNHDSVSILLNKADEWAKAANDNHNRIDILIINGLNEFYSSNLRKDTTMIIDITNNFGTIAYDQHKIDESLEYYWKALGLYEKINDQQGIALSYNNIGLAWLDKKGQHPFCPIDPDIPGYNCSSGGWFVCGSLLSVL
ncbi:MAG: tetratricopeptide repeat protein [Bacteroidota bacterium]|nr:tetratricopeptide repeat protein [Bacteroidota bacterium]